MQDNGFEVRHEENLREHYAMTLRDWCTNLDAHWDEAVAEVGEADGPGLAALHGRLAARLRRTASSSCTRCSASSRATGESGMPLRPDWGV